MAGKIKKIIDCIIAERAKGNPVLISTTVTKLIVKGINPNAFTPASPDDPAVILRLKEIAAEMGIKITV